ncbi:hypothetical protein [Rhizobium grahamii]|uniref:Uncharacterized protein n=1 Tax=Rhizobium grahamii CCGE 502 TaxID=990285 RepID=S3HIL3_9HYPH|nr:hypothetical protein [Rhizobium grahamii]EPE98594.1 hypothetical protein RGCCGE502_09215 [Rhizobium grahamii CCGE 502]
MRILRIDRASPNGDDGYSTVATFDVALSDHVRVLGMRLVAGPRGSRLAYGPNAAGGKRCVTFSREAALQITRAAMEALAGDRKSHEATSTKDIA